MGWSQKEVRRHHCHVRECGENREGQGAGGCHGQITTTVCDARSERPQVGASALAWFGRSKDLTERIWWWQEGESAEVLWSGQRCSAASPSAQACLYGTAHSLYIASADPGQGRTLPCRSTGAETGSTTCSTSSVRAGGSVSFGSSSTVCSIRPTHRAFQVSIRWR